MVLCSSSSSREYPLCVRLGLVMALFARFEVFSFCLGTRGLSGRSSTELVFDSTSKFSKFGSTRFRGDRA